MDQRPGEAPAATIVIFGASGDLTQRKLVPALFSLFVKRRLHPSTRILGMSRSLFSDQEYRDKLAPGVQDQECLVYDQDTWDRFATQIRYCPGDINKEEDLAGLQRLLKEVEGGPANRLYYLATMPELYAPTVDRLGAAGMTAQDEGWRRIIVEKPFGRDLRSAQELNGRVHAAFDESQVYRIDHYLGKETAQNIAFLRFANAIYEPVWNRNYVDHVQITVAETVKVGRRAGYYDQSGVLRDMFQNHLLQLLSLVAMEPANSFDADAVRDEKSKVLAALRPLTGAQLYQGTMRAQYQGYREEPGVAPDSQTPTYAALRLFIDNWRWQGVPFYLRSGKALAAKSSEVVIQFKTPPHLLFPLPEGRGITPNRLAICIQPNEGIHLSFQAKAPDTVADMRTVDMAFDYESSFGKCSIPDAYERLLLDALLGDASLFARSDAIELAWRFMDPVLQAWEKGMGPELTAYQAGTWGPAEADDLMRRDGRTWLHYCDEG
ncbi:MAG TPA: glucose-6-phosphate dehydrogenase [Armatimonadota bacterium]